MKEQCQRCKKIQPGCITIYMSCAYDMTALNIPFRSVVIQGHIQDRGRIFHTVRACKDCRGDWLEMIERWFSNIPRKPKVTEDNVLKVRGEDRLIEEFG
jgi:hypothetical protein